MRRSALALVLTVSSFSIAPSAFAADNDPIRIAYSRKNVVVCQKVMPIDVRLLVIPISQDRASYDFLASMVTLSPVRWNLGHGRLWIGQIAGAGVGVYNYDFGQLHEGKRSCSPGGTKYRMTFASGGGISKHRMLADSVLFRAEAFSDYFSFGTWEPGMAVVSNVGGRLVPLEAENGHSSIFRAVITDEERTKPKWSLEIYRCVLNWDKANKMWVEDKWVLDETLEPAFGEAFQVLRTADAYYFVTSSGRLFFAPGPGKKGQPRKVLSAWNDAERPITHFLTDADADRTFLFCKPAKEGEPGVYFELGPKPDPKPYDLSKVKPSKADEPLKGVLERARFLADQKLLKNPDPPKDEKKP